MTADREGARNNKHNGGDDDTTHHRVSLVGTMAASRLRATNRSEPHETKTTQRKTTSNERWRTSFLENIINPGQRRGNNDVHSESAYETFYGNCHSGTHMEQRVGSQRVEQSLQRPKDNRIVATTTKYATTDTFYRATIGSSYNYGTLYRSITFAKGCDRNTERVVERVDYRIPVT